MLAAQSNTLTASQEMSLLWELVNVRMCSSSIYYRRSEGESEQILSRNPIKETDSIVTKVIVHVCSEVLLLSSKRFSVQLSLSFLLLTAAPECLYRFLNPCGSVLVSHVNL